MQTVLRPFDDWPAREHLLPDPSLADLGAGIVRELDEVRAAVGVYATRIGRVRAAVQALIGTGATPVWCRRISLRCSPLGRSRCGGRRSPSISANGEMGEAEVIEESRPTGSAYRPCWREAQSDWGALSWLCWSVGLDRVALPEALAEPRSSRSR